MSGIELAALASAVASAAPYVAAGSAGLSAVSSIASGQQQVAAMRQNAAAQRQAGHNERMAAEAEAARVSDRGRRQSAAAFNQLAGSGVDAASGSGADLMDDLAAGSALDASIARWRGTQSQVAREQQASFMRREAGQTQRAAWWRAGSTLLTAGSRLFADDITAAATEYRLRKPPAGVSDGMF